MLLTEMNTAIYIFLEIIYIKNNGTPAAIFLSISSYT